MFNFKYSKQKILKFPDHSLLLYEKVSPSCPQREENPCNCQAFEYRNAIQHVKESPGYGALKDFLDYTSSARDFLREKSNALSTFTSYSLIAIQLCACVEEFLLKIARLQIFGDDEKKYQRN